MLNTTAYEEVIQLAKLLLEQDCDLAQKPTKAERKRIRTTLNDMKKLITDAKKELIALDNPPQE